MKNKKWMLIGMLIAPWFSLPLLGKKSFKRFLPAVIFINIVIFIESIIAYKRKWWWFYEKLHRKINGEFPLMWGPFFIGSFWIMKFTYGRFRLYMLTNFIIDSLFVFPGILILRKLGIASLVRLKHYQLLILFLYKAIILYIFQFFKESISKKR
ncbi:hypothetical protein [Neobacillus sp. D3-1R]|uniref:hypothetical protein n=1 Tax=Neobacillus sp. D3-1R TaxID=3445778 RepID=UPI003F9F8111